MVWVAMSWRWAGWGEQQDHGIFSPFPLFYCQNWRDENCEIKWLKGLPLHKRTMVHYNFKSEYLLLKRKVTDMRYSAEAHLCCSSQTSVFYHIILNDTINTFLSLISSIKRLLCAVVVSAYFLISLD